MTQTRPRALLEVPIFGPSSASAAVLAGAARLELNAAGSYPDGGTTPSIAELVAVNAALASPPLLSPVSARGRSPGNQHGVPVRVMIRPRGPPPPPPDTVPGAGSDAGIDFQYTPAEVDVMLASISELKPHLDSGRGDGFVFGALSVAADTTTICIDEQTCKTLLAAASPLPCVLHRAFDLLVSPPSSSSSSSSPPSPPSDVPSPSAIEEAERIRYAVGTVKDLGFAGILTSGGVGDAVDNLRSGRLAEVVIRAGAELGYLAGETVGSHDRAGGEIARVEIIIGGGVRSVNVADILDGVGRLEMDVDDSDKVRWVHSSCLTQKGSEGVDGDEVRRIVDAISGQ